MTEKYFGEFLVSRDIISQSQLIEALIEQIESTPPICKIAYQEKLLSDEQLLKVFNTQQEHNVDFIHALSKSDLDVTSFKEKLPSLINKYRKPLGQILVAKNYIDLKVMTNMLDEFLAQLTENIKHQNNISDNESPQETNELNESQADLSELDSEEVIEFQPGILMELEESFDERKYKAVKTTLLFLQKNISQDKEKCKKLVHDSYKIMHSVYGLLMLLALDKLCLVIEAIDQRLNKLESDIDSFSEEDLITISHDLLAQVDFMWSYRNSILEKSNEIDFLKASNHFELFKSITEN